MLFSLGEPKEYPIYFSTSYLKSKGHLAILVCWLIYTPILPKPILSPSLSCSIPWRIDSYWGLYLVFLLVGFWLGLNYRRLGLDSGSGILLGLANRKQRQEIWGVKGWGISSWLLPSFDIESLAVFPLLLASSSFWEAHSSWLLFSLSSRTTISSPSLLSPRIGNGLSLLLVSEHLTLLYLAP